MASRYLYPKIIAGVVMIGFLLTSAGFAFARTISDTNTPADVRMSYIAENFRRGCEIQTPWPSLVAEGIISQEQADEITLLINEKVKQMDKLFPPNPGDNPTTQDSNRPFYGRLGAKGGPGVGLCLGQDLLDDCLEAGILTEEQVPVIKEFYQEKMLANQQECMELRRAQIEAKLGPLVEEGVLSQEQAAAITAAFSQQQQERQADFNKIKNLTEEERRDYSAENRREKPPFKNNRKYLGQHQAAPSGPKNQMPNPWQELVDNGALTQEQAAAAAQVLAPGFKNK